MARDGAPPKQVVLVGGSGFVGSNLAYALAQSGDFTPIVLDTNDEKLALRFGGRGKCAFRRCDVLTDGAVLEAAIEEADIVINLVSHVLPKTFLDNPLGVIDVTLHGSMNVINAAVRHKKRLMHFSTSEVYGKTGGSEAPFSEDHSDCTLGPIDNHRWIYSTSKQLLDRIIHAHGLAGDLEYAIVRPFNFVGPLMDWLDEGDGAEDAEVPRVFASFMSALLHERAMQLVDGGKSRRCFTFIDDATSALIHILRDPEGARNQIFNIGNPGNETTIAELAELMRGIYAQEAGTGRPIEIKDVPAEQFYGSGYEDCDRRMPDIGKITALGWQPQVDLQETFERSMRFCVDNASALGVAVSREAV
ncbi:NAD-dependent epimerase/dehydratase family protein [Shimia haliotis]|uniref:UDP-apiose/xylose synthase n=1 Tax=Shimia haliotis TaxID=1280847 RepID=A0A1I4FYW5_9RHOB|nr:NAD-dependent epimerase/dehydratase family protein [Shimia haliotis]SFL23082.1 UDP-apiose/xylose synthase [Shimia haliotis]